MIARTNSHADKTGLLIIHPGALGDVLLARPVLHALRVQFPQHEFALLSANAVGSLLRDCAEVDRTFPLEAMHLSQLFAGFESLGGSFRTWLGTCERAVGWLRDAEAAVSNTLRTVGVRYINLQSPFSSDLVAVHQADRYFEAIGIEGSGKGFTYPLVLPADLKRQSQAILQACDWSGESPLVLIHPGSGSVHKCVEAGRLATVIEWLIKAGMTPILIEGPADCQTVAKVLSSLTTQVPVIRSQNLSAVAGAMAKAALYLGHDSGMTHLAAALAIPTVACFGPTHASRWAPLGPTVSIVSGMPCVCSNWSEVERCHERVCLQIPSECMIEACRTQLMRRS